MYKFKLKPELMERIQATRQNPKWEPDIVIRIAENKEKAKAEDIRDKSNIKVYTDSLGVDRYIGATAVLYQDGVLKRTRLGSVKHHTVYKGEGIGLILGVELIREEEMAEGMVPLGIDNVAAISATMAIKLTPSHYIWDILPQRVAMTYNKHKKLDLLVKWTPGHMGIIGNKRADEEVKKATRDGLSLLIKLLVPLRKTLPQSKSATKQEHMLKLKVAALDLWKGSIRYERMMCIDSEFKHDTFIKLIHKLH